MTPFRTVSPIVVLFGFAVAFAGCASVETGDTFRYGFSEVRSNAAPPAARPIPADFQLRAKSWKHEWRCDVFNTCTTDFLSAMFVFDTRTGREIKWNRVEVFLKDDCNATINDRDRYKTVTDTEVVSFGWGDNRKGKHEHVSALLVFYSDWGSVSARVRTVVCP